MSMKNNLGTGAGGMAPVMPLTAMSGAQFPMQSPQSLLLMSGSPNFSGGANMFQNPMQMPWAGQFGQGQLGSRAKGVMPMNGAPASLNSNTSTGLDAGKGSFASLSPNVGPSQRNPLLRFAY